MKKLLLFIFLFASLSAFTQVVAYKPINAYARAKETLWEWEELNIGYDEMPVIKVYYNNSRDAFSKIDRIIITNTFKDDFKFPYRGVSSGNGVLYNVIDNSGKKIKIFFDFSGYEDDVAYFDLIFKYSNIEYAYRILKQ
jgi:hypothetical protein